MGVAPVHSGDSQAPDGKDVTGMRKKVLILLLIGFCSGLVVGNIIPYFSSGCVFPWVADTFAARIGNGVAAFVLQTVLSGLYGAACMAGIALYDIEDWSILRATLVHYAIVIVGYLIISLLLDWNARIAELIIILGIMTVIFAAIWLVMYLIYRKQVKELNALNEKQRNRTEQKR